MVLIRSSYPLPQCHNRKATLLEQASSQKLAKGHARWINSSGPASKAPKGQPKPW